MAWQPRQDDGWCGRGGCGLAGLPVLLVGRDPLAAMADARALAEAGCRTWSVTDAPQALRLAAARSFRLLVTDFDLPGTDGFDLASQLRRLQPRLAAIILAAADEIGPGLPTLFEDGRTRLLHRPAGPAALLPAAASLACPLALAAAPGCRHG
ncbi:response regulator [Paracraurococcus ruber]|uniref:Response regulatory domain-containing protein n=1 Tax=Paracraurococcus ruber TaxID=77675 RepID=A0ABS1D6M0_9PROT|nr:response regulator [Paracraurococcus ruber]MBK1662368.1 hypothetical protein [Paracraurococcus ruber]TDG10676.1 response regulator [Paracraurococcus ruber]